MESCRSRQVVRDAVGCHSNRRLAKRDLMQLEPRTSRLFPRFSPATLLAFSSFAVGSVLLALTAVGRFVSLEPKNIDSFHDQFGRAPGMSRSQVLDVIAGESHDIKRYVTDLNQAIHLGVLHCGPGEDACRRHLRIPLINNFVLWGLAFVWPEKFAAYELFDHRRALDRRLGNCSQKVIILTGILQEKGTRAHVFSLGSYPSPRGRPDGHVVAAVQVGNDEWWVADPDYGVVLPLGQTAIESDPAAAAARYALAGYGEAKVRSLAFLLEKDQNKVFDRHAGARGYSVKKYYFEKLTYAMTWLVPLGMMAPFLVRLVRRRYATG